MNIKTGRVARMLYKGSLLQALQAVPGDNILPNIPSARARARAQRIALARDKERAMVERFIAAWAEWLNSREYADRQIEIARAERAARERANKRESERAARERAAREKSRDELISFGCVPLRVGEVGWRDAWGAQWIKDVVQRVRYRTIELGLRRGICWGDVALDFGASVLFERLCRLWQSPRVRVDSEGRAWLRGRDFKIQWHAMRWFRWGIARGQGLGWRGESETPAETPETPAETPETPAETPETPAARRAALAAELMRAALSVPDGRSRRRAERIARLASLVAAGENLSDKTAAAAGFSSLRSALQCIPHTGWIVREGESLTEEDFPFKSRPVTRQLIDAARGTERKLRAQAARDMFTSRGAPAPRRPGAVVCGDWSNGIQLPFERGLRGDSLRLFAWFAARLPLNPI